MSSNIGTLECDFPVISHVPEKIEAAAKPKGKNNVSAKPTDKSRRQDVILVLANAIYNGEGVGSAKEEDIVLAQNYIQGF